MPFFHFITNILTTILLSYLSLTNTLAHHIETLIPKLDPDEIVESPVQEIPPALGEVTRRRGPRKGGVPRILLDHPEFQKAALIASERKEADTPSDTEPLDETTKNALVNVYCQYKTKQYIRTTTGSGYFINPKGVIITNAHIAQFLLLKDVGKDVHDVNCVIRTGDPATPKYKAELLYISPTWIYDNTDLIVTENPRGTGERDYALLYISKSVNDTPLPTHFPSISSNVSLLSRSVIGSPVLTAGYPAGALMRGGADAKLLPITAKTNIGVLYTFGSNYADIFSVSESPVGEQGASGGPIVAEDSHKAIGLIVTKGDEKTEGFHSLRALTLSYIDRTITEETGFSLAQNMQGDVAYRGSIFKKAMVPFLAGILEEKLKKKQ